jgi:hypothetical protein
MLRSGETSKPNRTTMTRRAAILWAAIVVLLDTRFLFALAPPDMAVSQQIPVGVPMRET